MKKAFIILFLIAWLLPSCDENQYSYFPYAPVNLEIRLEYEDVDLVPILAYKSITDKKGRKETTELGFGGILAINGYNTRSTTGSEIYAFDLGCPVEAKEGKLSQVVPDDTGLTATCPTCGEIYQIAHGSGNPTQGNKHPLRLYSKRESGWNRYLILN